MVPQTDEGDPFWTNFLRWIGVIGFVFVGKCWIGKTYRTDDRGYKGYYTKDKYYKTKLIKILVLDFVLETQISEIPVGYRPVEDYFPILHPMSHLVDAAISVNIEFFCLFFVAYFSF